MTVDPRLFQYATEDESELLREINEHGSMSEAARVTGRGGKSGHKLYSRALARVKANAVAHGYSPEHKMYEGTPVGMVSRGPSILTDANGVVRETWNKMKPEGIDPEDSIKIPGRSKIARIATNTVGDKVTQQWVTEVPEKMAVDEGRIIAILNEKVEQRPPVTSPEAVASDLMTVYPVGDHHFGMLAWAEEVLADYDIKIGQQLLHDAMGYLVDNSPASGTALIALMGDFMHWSGETPITPRSGHALDADSRLGRVVDIAIESTIYLIERALEKHEFVRVIVEFGNHDGAGMVWLSRSMKHIFALDDRVSIDTAPGHFHGFAFGNNFVGTHHGHGRAAKFKDLPLIFLNDFDEFATCKKRLILTGHVHHKQVEEIHGVQVESLGILPPQDAHAFNEGYRSIRRMHSIWMHREFGEINRPTVTPEMLSAIGTCYDCNSIL